MQLLKVLQRHSLYRGVIFLHRCLEKTTVVEKVAILDQTKGYPANTIAFGDWIRSIVRGFKNPEVNNRKTETSRVAAS